MKVEYITNIERVDGLSKEEKKRLKKVTEKFAFRANTYYLSLIDWSDPNDPIRKIIIPSEDELEEEWGSLDPSNEKRYTVAPGVEHKYKDTALVLFNNLCAGYCRYCFRKRLFIKGNKEIIRDPEPALKYIKEHPEIDNVLISGGDPLLLSDRRLEEILAGLRSIDHVKIIRIGTKIPAFNPYRILNDDKLLRLIEQFSFKEKRIYMMVHFCHEKELTPPAIKAIDKLISAGAIVCNQTPLIRGVNDNPEALANLLNKLSFIGATPYYIFQCRPTTGNKVYSVPVEEGLQIFEKAKVSLSGLAKRAKFVMSHMTGKIEILGIDNSFIYMKYHRTPDQKVAEIMKFERNPEGYWLEDFKPVSP